MVKHWITLKYNRVTGIDRVLSRLEIDLANDSVLILKKYWLYLVRY